MDANEHEVDRGVAGADPAAAARQPRSTRLPDRGPASSGMSDEAADAREPGIQDVGDAAAKEGGTSPSAGSPPPRGRRRVVSELLVLVGIAFAVTFCAKSFVVQPFVIPSGSMESSLHVGDRILVSKLSYRFAPIRHGDVIVFDGTGSFAPDDIEDSDDSGGGLLGLVRGASSDYVKRVIGLPGDRVTCCDTQGRIIVNGVPLSEPYIFPGDKPSRVGFDVVVPPGKLWVMGDHRDNSQDSRAYLGKPGGGFVPEERVIGRAFLVAWPFKHWGTVPRPETFK